MPSSYFRVRTIRASTLYNPPGSDVMRKVGEDVIPQIVNRTKSGLDEKRRSFTPYSLDGPKAGKRVTLTESGKMLKGLAVIKVGPKTFKLGWRNAKLGLRALFQHKGTVNIPDRRFVGFPKSWAIEALRKHWKPWKRRAR